jgi:hypothetical protein
MARRTAQSPARAENAETLARSWRCTGFAWFWGNDRDDFGSVLSQAGRFVATTARGSAEFDILGDAKTFVEEHSS